LVASIADANSFKNGRQLAAWLGLLPRQRGKAIQGIASGEVSVPGATSFLWAREDAANVVDVLFVDEAAQMSLANVL
jgi:hypothetical protein